MLKRSYGLMLWAFFFGILLGGCAPARQAEHVEFSGFLDDYSMLSPGGNGEALFVYRNPHADWASYDAVLLDPVLIRPNSRAQGHQASIVDLQQATNLFFLLLYQELSRDYEIVTAPGPGTLVIQMALTDVERSSAEAETMASVFPPAILISAGKEYMTGRPIFVSGASFEGRISDGLSGELLAAGVDRRIGGKTLKGATDSWSDIHNSLDFWSRKVHSRLCEWRRGSGYIGPHR